MNLSFWTLGTPGWSNEAVVDAAKRFGFQGIDIRCMDGGNISLNSSDDEIAALKNLFATSGVEIASLLAYNKRGNEKGADWPAVEADLIENARLAAKLGTRSMRVNAGRPAEQSTWDAYLEELARVLAAALRAVPGVSLFVQNHPGSLSASRAGDLAQIVGSERFGVGLSPDHCIDMEEDIIGAVERIAPWVRQVHLADRVHLPDGKLKACLPGDGFVPNREVLDELTRHGFDGWVSFKWEKPTYPDLPGAEAALPRFVSFMSKVVT